MTSRRAFLAVLPAAAAVSLLPSINVAASDPVGRMSRRDQPTVGVVNIAGESVMFDHSLAPATTRVLHEDSGLVAHLSHPELGAQYVVLDSWGELQVTPLVEHADYARLAAHPRLGFRAELSSGGRPYLVPVMVIGKVLDRRDLPA